MGTITSRPRKDGTIAYLAQITIKEKGKIVHRENRTFDRETTARAWIKNREKAAATAEGRVKIASQSAKLSDAIGKYVQTSLKEIGKTKAQVLNSIKTYDIADMACHEIKSTDIVKFFEELKVGRSSSTVGNYASHLASVFAIARPAWGMPLESAAMHDAVTVAKRLGLITKSNARERRPTMDELDKLMTYFGERRVSRPEIIPMQQICAFTLFSTRRQEEIVTIRWDDLEREHKRVLVRDMKNPGEKIGNNVWCSLPDEALDIIGAMPEVDERIFPFNTDAVSASFTRACKILGIEDLHFHDLRHEGITRLFEMGWGIPQTAAVSGHRSWQSLKRYTHIMAAGDRYENWKWLPIVTTKIQVQKKARRARGSAGKLKSPGVQGETANSSQPPHN